jgi:LAS superfamily LD-carboxypeptidase LdcB
VSPFDLESPAVARLDGGLLRAVQGAGRDAANDGVDLLVTSGWRSPEYQKRLLTEAVAEYGSIAEARRYVATPETSAHVTGRAVDIGPPEANSWLSRNGARYGLCQRYANEPWHFELLTVPGGDCPAFLPDAGAVPRSQ